MYIKSYCSCVCVCACSFLQSSRPTSQIYLNISNFYHRPAVFVPCSCVRCACGGGAVVVCSHVFLCECSVYFPGRAPGGVLCRSVSAIVLRVRVCVVVQRCRDLRVCRCLSFTKLCRKTVCSRASLSVCLSLCAYVLM